MEFDLSNVDAKNKWNIRGFLQNRFQDTLTLK